MSGLPLITGATGFAGSHLIDSFVAEGRGASMSAAPVVTGWSNPHGAPVRDARAQVQWHAVDLLDRDAVFKAIADLRPSAIFHCGGAADVGTSWTDPVTPLRTNTLGTHHLIDAVRHAGLRCPVLVTGSALVYRASLDAMTEDSPIGPSNPYALSKLAQETIALRDLAALVFVTRSFNHAGPRQSSTHVTSAFARQIAEIEAGAREPVLRVGNLDARRDLSDVRDVVRAYRLLVEHGEPGRPYNVCSGKAYRIGDLLDTLLTLSAAHIRVMVDPERLRPSDNPLVLGSPERLCAATGWSAAIPIEQTLRDLLDYWRARVAVPRS